MRRRALHPIHPLLLSILLMTGAQSFAHAAPVLGFVETWPSGTRGWGGGLGQITFSNPGTGGFDGNDGYLRMARTTAGNFGARSTGLEYQGNWTAAGINRVTVRLSDFGVFPLEIHLAIGQQTNLWEYDPGFIPAPLEWGEYVVDLADSASFTNIIEPVDGGSFRFAMQHVEVVHIRHDLAPFEQNPDVTAGTLGIDHLALTNNTVGVEPLPPGVTRAVELAPPAPNPSRGPVALTLHVSDASPVTVRVVDALGRVVREDRVTGGAGVRLWLWDGRDGNGQRAPAGVYRALAWSHAGGMSRSVVRVD